MGNNVHALARVTGRHREIDCHERHVGNRGLSRWRKRPLGCEERGSGVDSRRDDAIPLHFNLEVSRVRVGASTHEGSVHECTRNVHLGCWKR